MLAGMPFWSSAQLLKEKADGGIQELQVEISLDGDQGAMEYRLVELKEDGTFEFDTGLISPFNDVMVFVDDNEIVGAHLELGKTLELMLHREKDRDCSILSAGITGCCRNSIPALHGHSILCVICRWTFRRM